MKKWRVKTDCLTPLSKKWGIIWPPWPCASAVYAAALHNFRPMSVSGQTATHLSYCWALVAQIIAYRPYTSQWAALFPSLKIALSHGGIWTPHTWFLGPIESSTQMSDDVLLGDWCDVLGSVAFSRKHPLACWVSSMLMCFATSIVSNFLVGESLVIPLKNHQEIIVATAVWYDLLPAVIIKLRG